MTKLTKILLAVILLALILPTISILGVSTLLSSNNISYPSKDHAHFRLQYVYHTVPENFADAKYQTPYEKNQCNGSLANEPLHIHDYKNQIIHFHWARVTGGQVLKNYGLNLIGGQDEYLGYKLNELTSFKVQPVPIFGKVLPKPLAEDKIWVYTGEMDKNVSRSLEDFKNQDVETFLGKPSLVRQDEEKYGDKTGFLGSVVAQAHGDEGERLADAKTTNSEALSVIGNIKPPKTEEELKVIHNLLGNIVVFVQPTEPTEVQVQDRFNNLEPLTDSVCGG